MEKYDFLNEVKNMVNENIKASNEDDYVKQILSKIKLDNIEDQFSMYVFLKQNIDVCNWLLTKLKDKDMGILYLFLNSYNIGDISIILKIKKKYIYDSINFSLNYLKDKLLLTCLSIVVK